MIMLMGKNSQNKKEVWINLLKIKTMKY